MTKFSVEKVVTTRTRYYIDASSSVKAINLARNNHETSSVKTTIEENYMATQIDAGK